MKVLNSVLDVYSELSACHLIIKIHPLEEESYYTNKIKDKTILVVKEKILHEHRIPHNKGLDRILKNLAAPLT